MVTRVSSEDIAGVQAANSELRARVERLTVELADAQAFEALHAGAISQLRAAEARVRELEARPVVVRDEACRNAVEQVANWIDGHISRGDLSDAIRAALNGEG